MKITTSVTATDKDGNTVSLAGSGSDPAKFAIVEPGYYLAVVRKVEAKKFNKPVDGSPTWLKLVPTFELVNEPKTLINRQDFMVGAVDENDALYRPDGDTTKPALWGGKQGAQYLLFALGLLKEVGEGQYEIDADPELVFDRVVKVKVDTGEYTSSDGEIKQKNVVSNVFALNREQAEKVGYIFEDGAVYENRLAYVAAQARASKSAEPTF